MFILVIVSVRKIIFKIPVVSVCHVSMDIESRGSEILIAPATSLTRVTLPFAMAMGPRVVRCLLLAKVREEALA